MDSEFLALSFVFILIGLAGVVLFNGPMTPAGDSCYCLIPSPEPHAAQGTSSIILALGVIFFPMGLMKGGLPSFRRGPAVVQKQTLGGAVVTPVQVSSGGLFTLGIIMLVAGVDALLVPGYLVFHSLPVALGGAGLAVLGVLAVVFGWRKPRASGQ